MKNVFNAQSFYHFPSPSYIKRIMSTQQIHNPTAAAVSVQFRLFRGTVRRQLKAIRAKVIGYHADTFDDVTAVTKRLTAATKHIALLEIRIKKLEDAAGPKNMAFGALSSRVYRLEHPDEGADAPAGLLTDDPAGPPGSTDGVQSLMDIYAAESEREEDNDAPTDPNEGDYIPIQVNRRLVASRGEFSEIDYVVAGLH